MTQLKSPNLDDRDFQQLVEEGKRIISSRCPQWTDLSPGDPGMVILEVFAHLTETMIYRLNRLPEKAYIEFLRLIGVKLSPPVAAGVKLRFTLSKAQDKELEIPRGTRVTLARTGGGEPPPVFVVLQSVSIPAGKTAVDGVAYHCDLIQAEDAGTATGLPSLSVTARRPPIVAPTSDHLELIVGVEADADELKGRARAINHNAKAYVVWLEVEDLSNLAGRQQVYIADRLTGTITFAPAARLMGTDGRLEQNAEPLADVPKAGREIRLWYCSGGGLVGNVAANTLTTLKDPIPGVTVTNPEPATGGSDAETIENALIRGPQQLHSLRRAVTVRDFELLAKRSSGAVARAKAYTQASLWEHATPGTVEVLIVPEIPEAQRPNGVVTEEALVAQQTDEAIATVQGSLDEAKPLGTRCLVHFVRYKVVSVHARAVIHRGEDAEAVKSRVLKRLHQTINPLPSSLPSAGWPFGRPLRASDVYDIMLGEPGVSFVDGVRLIVEEAPETNISALAADVFQPDTWYASTHSKLFRSMDNGHGWELINRFPDNEETVHIRVDNSNPGNVAVVTNPTNAAGSRLYVSDDCGETWRMAANTAFGINDLAWTIRQGQSVMLMATDKGLFELLLQPSATPVQIVVDANRPLGLGFTAVAAAVGVRGTPYVAVAVRSITGVSIYLSTKSGPSGAFDFEPLQLKDENISVLEIQQDGPRTFLWAGLALKTGSDAGKGAVKWELQGGTAGAPTSMEKGWVGGSCHGLAFTSSFAFAATHDKGVLWLDLSKGEQASWRTPLRECGLKIREDDVRAFQPVTALAGAKDRNVVMAGGASGIYRSDDNGTNYQLVSNKLFFESVTVSPTRLFCSGDHKVDVVMEDEA